MGELESSVGIGGRGEEDSPNTFYIPQLAMGADCSNQLGVPSELHQTIFKSPNSPPGRRAGGRCLCRPGRWRGSV